MKNIFVIVAFASLASACGTMAHQGSDVQAAKAGGVFKLVECPSLNPELGGHNTLYMDVVAGPNGLAKSFKAPSLEFAPAMEGEFYGKASVTGKQLSYSVSKGWLELSRAANGKVSKKAVIESITFDTGAGRVTVTYPVAGTTDVHYSSQTFENCKFSNLSLLAR